MLSLSLVGGTSDYVSGTQVFYKPDVAGGFAVNATATDPETQPSVHVQFPNVFNGTGALDDTTQPFSQTYTRPAGSTLGSPPFTVTASSAGGGSSASFTVTPDSTVPLTTASCNGGSCAGPFSSPVTVTLPSGDGGGSGTKSVYYTTNGVDPSAPADLYSGSFSLSATATVKFFAVDNVGNTETIKSQLVTIGDSTAPSTPALTLSALDTNDYVTGTSVFYNPSGTNIGGFKVDATTPIPSRRCRCSSRTSSPLEMVGRRSRRHRSARPTTGRQAAPPWPARSPWRRRVRVAVRARRLR